MITTIKLINIVITLLVPICGNIYFLIQNNFYSDIACVILVYQLFPYFEQTWVTVSLFIYM